MFIYIYICIYISIYLYTHTYTRAIRQALLASACPLSRAVLDHRSPLTSSQSNVRRLGALN